MLELQPARLGQRPELLNTQGPIRLRHACHVTLAGQRAAAASRLQPASQHKDHKVSDWLVRITSAVVAVSPALIAGICPLMTSAM